MTGAALAGHARADFVGGVERFNGSSFDLSTWEGHYTLGTTIQWNEKMIFDNRALDGINAGGRGEMVTLQPLVGVGEYVEAEVRISAATEVSPMASLRLSTKTHVNNSNLDSHTLEANLHPWFKGLNATQTQNGSGFGQWIMDPNTMPDMLGTTYILRIDRLSSTAARMSAFDAGHNPIGTSRTHSLVGFPDDMHVVVYSQQVAVTFDNVTTGTIPEPSAAAAAMIVALAGLVRRRP